MTKKIIAPPVTNGNSNVTPLPFPGGAPMIPAPGPTVVTSAVPVDPDVAEKARAGKVMPPVWQPPKAAGVEALRAGGTVEGAASFVELARALKNDPQLIYEFVYNNIEYTPGMGLMKGDFGTLLDGCGTSFDISALLIKLLRQAGFVAYYEVGSIQLTSAAAISWLDIKDNNINTALNFLTNLAVPASLVGTAPNQQLKLSHCWVKVNIGTVAAPNWVVMDPSYKTYTTPKATINLASAMGYSSSSFLSDARVGMVAVNDSGGRELYVQGVNRTNIRNNLTTLATNLANYIKGLNASNPQPAGMDDIVGGRQIVPVTLPVTFATSLSYQAPGTTPVEYTADLPTSLKITVRLRWSGLDVTLTSDQFYGRRFTWTFIPSGTTGFWYPQIKIDGTLVVTGTVQKPSGYYEAFGVDIVHNAYPTTAYDQINLSTGVPGFYVFVYCPNQNSSTGQENYLIAAGFGISGKGQIDYHAALQAQYEFATTNNLDETACGERLAVQWANYRAQQSRLHELVATQTKALYFIHHLIGVCKYQQYGTFQSTGFDLQGIRSSVPVLAAGVNVVPTLQLASTQGYTLETLGVQQLTGQLAASATRGIDIANSNGLKIYKATQTYNPSTFTWNSLNWTSDVKPHLIGYTPGPDYISTIENYWLPYSQYVMLPESAPEVQSPLNMFTWTTAADDGSNGAGIIYASFKGGVGPGKGIPPKKEKIDDCEEEDPVNMRTGDYLYRHTDLTIGSGSFPYQLSFETSYDSSRRYVQTPVGLGWRHNWSTSVTVGSDGLRGMGSESPISAAAMLAALVVNLDLRNTPTVNLDRFVMALTVDQWWVDALTNNIVTVSLPDYRDLVYTLLADGSYNPPQRNADVLTLSGGVYTHTTPQKVVSTFNAAGQLASIAFPYGMTITLSYSGGNLTTIANNRGRTLTLSYSGGSLSSVSDGTGRSVQYTVTGGNLVTFTDALSQPYTFQYDAGGKGMVKYFKPAHQFDALNPTLNACVTNTYDSLNRIQSQVDILGHVITFYLAGSRTEIVDPAGDSSITYYDQFTNPLKWVDALGYVTTAQYDALGRTTLLMRPELDSVSYQYDTMNNLKVRTRTAKPGSGLAALVDKFDYDPAWNKVSKQTDPNSNVVTFAYDPATSNLLTTTFPAVPLGAGSVQPVVTMTYNGFGQILTSTEPVSVTATIVTQMTYDPATETLKTITRDFGTGSHLNLSFQVGYDSVGNGTALTDSRGNTWVVAYDSLRRITQVNNPSPFASQQKQFGYDANSNKTSTKLGDGTNPWQQFTWTYSLSDKMTSVTDPAGHVEQKVYDGDDRLWKTIDAEGRTYQFAYDQLDRVHTVTDPTGVISEIRGYSPNGKLTSIQDANGNLTQFTFDGFDRPNKTIYPDSTYEQNLLYDANGNVKTFVTRLGPTSGTITATYDALNRLFTKAPAGQPTETYAYDLGNRLLSITDSVLGTYTRNYDSAGRFVQEVYPDSKTVTSTLDANGNVTRLTYPDGYFVDRKYDELNRLTSVSLNGAAFPEATFSYDYLSRRSALEFGNLTSSTYEFGLDNNLLELTHSFSGSSYVRSYSFNKEHQIVGQFISDSKQSWQPSSSFTDTYGNGLASGAANNLNEIVRLNSATNNFSYNANGCMTGDGTWTHTYDTENHLLSSAKTGTSLAFKHDPFHRQVQKSVTATGTTVTNYVYSGWQRIADYDGAGNLLNRYVYGATMDEAIIQVAPNGPLTFLHADHEGSIVATSDSSGKMVSKNVYGLFGEIASIAATNVGYTGQRFDSETGLYYYKRRYYTAKLGRFLQPDPIGYDIATSENCGCDCTGGCGGAEISTLNLFTYVNNDPLNSTDPYGWQGITVLSVTDELIRAPSTTTGDSNYSPNPSPWNIDPGPFGLWVRRVNPNWVKCRTDAYNIREDCLENRVKRCIVKDGRVLTEAEKKKKCEDDFTKDKADCDRLYSQFIWIVES